MAAALILPGALARADFRIEEIRLGAGNRLELHFPAEAASYCRLLHGDAVTAINTPVAVGLAGPLSVAAPAQAGFFRVQQLPRAAALDTDGDGRDDVTELLAGTDPLVRDEAPLNVTQFASSPADGDDGVAVARETVLRFTRPLAADVVLGNHAFFAEAAGRRVLTRTELSPDRRTATLFYLEPLPGATRVRVVFDGDKVRDAQGKLVDADGDGVEGGVGIVTFTTLNNLPVPRTAVIGRVFASELVPGPDTGTNALNRPLQGVIVTVDGQEETLRAVTDAQGNFRLEPAPAGRFFVHVDGRTAVGSAWPNGDYYPFVGKAWEAVPGRTDNLAGGTGEIYLPLIKAGSLQPVSPTEPTPVTFVPEVVAANPALAGVQILVPPGALFDDDGNRGGRVGIAPVPPDRLPEPLPEGLNFPLVITIQTDGPRNFAAPVPVRFPNLPDPVTGVKLPPGAKTALWSFDHDKGYWEIVGPATVTADGEFVETDPGVGVLQPGWHGVQPGVEVKDGKVVQECEPQGDAVMGPIFVADMGHGRRRLSVEAEAHTPGVVNWFCATAVQQGLNGDVVDFEFCEPGEHRITAVLSPDCYRPVRKSITVIISEEEVCSMEPLLFGGTLGMGEAVIFGPFDHTPGRIEWTVEGGRPSRGVGRTFRTVFCEPGVKRVTRKLITDCGRTCEVVEEFEVVDRTIAPFTGCFIGPAFAPIGPFYVGEVQTFYAPDTTAGTITWDAPQGIPDSGAGEEFRTVFDTPGLKTLMLHFRSECGQECSLEYTRLIEERPPAPQAVNPSAGAVPVRVKSVTQVTGAAGAAGEPEVALEVSDSRRGAALHADGPTRSLVTGAFYFWRQNLETGAQVRGRRGRGPELFPQPRQLAAETRYRIAIVTDDGRFGGTFDFTTGQSGSRLSLGDIILRPLTGPDTDGDGLTDFAEEVLGSNPNKADTDDDGVSDLAEALAGTPVNGATAEPLGMVAGAPTPGYAWDVAVVGDLAAVADSQGVSVFNVLNPAIPALVGRLQLPGQPRSVAGAGNRLLVGLGEQGVALVDLSTLPNLAAPGLRGFGAPVTAVAAGAGFGFVGLQSGRIVVVDPGTGTPLSEASTGGPVEDLLVVGTEVFALSLSQFGSGLQVTRWQVNGINLSQMAAADYEGGRGAGGRRLRLGAAGDRLYATHTAGVAVFDLAGGSLRSLPNHFDGQFGWKQIVPDGTGRGIAASDPNSTDDGAHDVQVFDLRPNGAGLRFDTQHPTPGRAEALVLSGNFALVADGPAGLTVIRHAEADRFGRPPTVTLRSPYVGGLAEEGRVGVFVADAADDVGVARVELFVDGVLAATDTMAPYDFAVLMPRRSAERTTVRLRARATDTGGNVGESAELVLTLTGDATAPEVRQVVPGFGAVLEGGVLTQVAAVLSEPLNPAGVTAGALRLFEAGADGQHRTADDVEITRGTVNYRPGLPGVTLDFGLGLASGRYRVVLAAGLADPAGNAMPGSTEWTFELQRPRVAQVRPTAGGIAAGRSLEVTFSAPMIPASVALGLSVHAPGPDNQFGTADDVRMAGAFSMPPGTTVARLDFSPGLPPGRYLAKVNRNVADGAGNTLAADVAWDFQVVHLNLGTGAVNQSGTLAGPFAADEFLLLVSGNSPVAISNPNRLEITLFAPDGSVLVRDNRDFFKAPVAGDGPHVLRVAKGDGNFTQGYALQLNRFTTRTFAHALSGAAPQTFTGRSSQNLADEDIFELTAEPGASYFIEPLGATFPCPHRWSVFDPAGVPVLLNASICTQGGALVETPAGGVIRVVMEAARNGVQARLRVTRGQERIVDFNLTAYIPGTTPQIYSPSLDLFPGDTGVIRFNVPAGAQFSFARSDGPGCLPWRLTGPDGAVLFAADCPEVALPDTSAGGVFTLRVRNNTTLRQFYRVLVRPVIERVFDLVDLTDGAVHRFAPASDINGPGSRDVHRFLLPGDVPVVFGLGRWSGPHLWELQDTAGRRIFGPVNSWAERVQTVSVSAGEYQLILTGTVNSTGFSSGYWIVAGRPGVETTTHDLRTSRLLEVREDNSLPGHRRVIEVDLDADQVVEINFGAGDEGCEQGLAFRFLAPDGSVCLETQSGECGRNGVLQLGAAGRYRAEIVAEPDARPQGWWLRIERSRLAAGQWLPLPGAEQMPALNATDFNEGGMALLVRDGGGTLAQTEIFLAGRFGGQTLIGRLHNGVWQTLGAATRPAGGGFSTLPVINAIVHDGTALYVAGNFTEINGAPTPGVARWDGTLWTTLGSGVRVTDTEWFGELYEVKDLAFVDGQLYAAGRFRVAGGVQTFNLARWDPVRAEWNKVAGPLFSEHLDGVGGQRGPNDFGEVPLSLATLGDTLFIAGTYQFPSRNVGAWRNHRFADGLGGGVMESTFNPGEARLVRTANGLAYFQGNFRRAGVLSGNVEVDGFAVWTGTEWRRAPTLLPFHNSTRDFAVDGDRIAVGGSFNRVNNDFFGRPEEERDSIPVNGVALWDGAVWRSPGLGVQLDLEGGGGGGGGGEGLAGLAPARGGVALHDNGAEPPRLLPPGEVNRLQLAGRRLYVTGRFTHAGGQPSPPLAVWESAP
ncbi:MAG: Ig-like domain-containing protein [Verrucomicrobia bacterium]|nr:Ig-like domain-containing protein [Verrucomicrobiota bacterium]